MAKAKRPEDFPESGTIERTPDGVVVRSRGGSWLADLVSQGRLPGVECEDGRPAKGKIFRKVFTKAKIWIGPDEYYDAFLAVLGGEDIIRIGQNGYSNLDNLPWDEWGVKGGGPAYIEGCACVLGEMVKTIEGFHRVDAAVAHGASDVGVDHAIRLVAREYKLPNLGHSCPDYMLYVADDERDTIWVGHDRETYSDMFVNSCDILLSCNGKETSFRHDWKATFEGIKRPDGSVHRPKLIPLNVLRALTGGKGPRGIGPKGEIIDATAAFEELVMSQANPFMYDSKSPWDDLVNHAKQAARVITRGMVSPERAYGAWRRTA